MARSGGRNPPAPSAKVPADKRRALLAVLAQDPRPSYQADPTRVYGMSFASLQIKFQVQDGILKVVDVE